MRQAFEVKLDRYQYAGQQYRARTGAISLPAELVESVEAVLGLDDRPQARAHFRIRGNQSAACHGFSRRFLHALPGGATLSVPGLDATGSGQTVGDSGTKGADRSRTDLKNYFASLGVTEPTVISVSVDKGKNKPTNPNSADGEVLLDIEVVGAVAPGAKIVIYFAAQRTLCQGFQDALTTRDSRCHEQTVRYIESVGAGPESTCGQLNHSDDRFRLCRSGRGCAGSHNLCRLWRQRIERRGHRWSQSRRFSGIQPARPRVRWNKPPERQGSNHERNGLERRRPRRGDRRRFQQSVSTTQLAGQRKNQASNGRRPGCAGCGNAGDGTFAETGL